MKTKRGTFPIDRMFRALSDRTRLRLMSLLLGGERCVCELVDVLGDSQPKVSRHLGYLRRAGLVTARKEGPWAYYTLAEPRGAMHVKILECLAQCSVELPDLMRDRDRLKRCCGSSGNCC